MTSIVSLLPQNLLNEQFKDSARFVKDTEEACEKLKNINSKVLFAPLQGLTKASIEKMLSIREHLQFIVFVQKASAANHIDLISHLIQLKSFAGIVEYSGDKFSKDDFAKIENLASHSIVRHDQHLQDAELESMRSKELEELNQLAQQLAQQSEIETQKLQQSQIRSQHLKQKIETLHSSLMAIHQSQSLNEIDGKLNQVLVNEFDLQWIKVLFGSATQFEGRLESELGDLLHKVTFATEQSIRGTLIAAKKTGKKWTAEDKNLMDQIASAVLLAYEKLSALQQAEQFKQQWETTFDSIDIPLGLVDDDSRCLRANKAFAKALDIKFEEIIGSEIFKKITPATNEPRSSNVMDLELNTSGGKRLYRAILQPLPRSFEQRLRILILFDVTERRNIEKIIFHNAKMAEIGTIGSSMAHELNNPIGGMLTFAQLLKQDVPNTDSAFQDIESIENAIVRAKDIVQTLLGFSRKPDLFEREQFSLKELLNVSSEMVRIHTRSLGIEIQMDSPGVELNLTGSPSLLTQAFYDILMQAYLNVLRRKFKENRYLGTIRIELTITDQTVVLSLRDDGFVPEGTDFANLGLSVAKQILSEHGYAMEISVSTNAEMTAKISIPRPEF